jgi:hypothetical protein
MTGMALILVLLHFPNAHARKVVVGKSIISVIDTLPEPEKLAAALDSPSGVIFDDNDSIRGQKEPFTLLRNIVKPGPEDIDSPIPCVVLLTLLLFAISTQDMRQSRSKHGCCALRIHILLDNRAFCHLVPPSLLGEPLLRHTYGD